MPADPDFSPESPPELSPELSPGLSPELSIVIVSYNTADETVACLASLTGIDHGVSSEIIVVDNGSRDDSVTRIRAMFPSVIVIDTGVNAGFAAGNNVGIARARGRFVLMLNPDTVMPEGTLRAVCARLAAEPATGLIGVPQKNARGELVRSAMRLLRPWHFLALAFVPSSGWIGRLVPGLGLRYEEHGIRDTFACDSVVGCFMATRRDVLDRVGGLEERIFMYAEEVEFAHRVATAGYGVLHLGDVHVVHLHGASTHAISVWRDVQMQAGQLVYMRICFGVWAARRTAAFMTLSHLIRLPVELAMMDARWRLRLASRLKRLRRSASAIVAPPTRTVQSID